MKQQQQNNQQKPNLIQQNIIQQPIMMPFYSPTILPFNTQIPIINPPIYQILDPILHQQQQQQLLLQQQQQQQQNIKTGIAGKTAEDWEIYYTNDDRCYYYNKVTKVTQWEKPEELYENQKNIISNNNNNEILTSSWMEFNSQETNEKYYYNTITNETTWNVPEEYKNSQEKTKRIYSN